jgi:hypothetical protein
MEGERGWGGGRENGFGGKFLEGGRGIFCTRFDLCFFKKKKKKKKERKKAET